MLFHENKRIEEDQKAKDRKSKEEEAMARMLAEENAHGKEKGNKSSRSAKTDGKNSSADFDKSGKKDGDGVAMSKTKKEKTGKKWW